MTGPRRIRLTRPATAPRPPRHPRALGGGSRPPERSPRAAAALLLTLGLTLGLALGVGLAVLAAPGAFLRLERP